GGIYSFGSLNLSNSTVSNNATLGLGSDGGGIHSVGSLSLNNSIISNNSSSRNGGGIYRSTDSSGAIATIRNSTISGNSSTDRGGGIINYEGLLQLRNSTVTNNTAPTSQGSGVASFGDSEARTEVVSSIIAGNTNTDVDIVLGSGANSFVSLGTNLIGDGNATGNFNQSGDQVIGNASTGLAALANNGGSTQTHALLAGSPAINVGSNPDNLTTDQRDTGFPRQFGGKADIGAFESSICPVSSNLTLYVNATAANGGDGLSWSTAYNNLQDALYFACNCGNVSEIWVARGTYIPSVALAIDDVNGIETREKTFQLCEGVKVYGGFAGTETQLNERNITVNVTILSGDLGNDDTDANNDDIIVATDIIGDNAYHVVYTNGVTSATVLDGFTITAGNATSFDGNQNNLFGAGMLNINNSAPTVNNCTFTGNNGVQGGGMGNRDSAPQVNYCKFINNLASGLLQGFTFGAGAGMSNDDSNPVLFACTFDGNEAKGFYAGAISSYGGSVTATNCVFSANKSKSSGGAFYCEGTNHTLTNCIFIGNMAGVGGFGRGGALSLSVGRQNFVNCLFAGNSAPDDGGAIAMDQFDNSSLINCTISGNKAGGSGGGIYMVEFLATPLTNCIIWNNQDNTGTGTVSSSISQSDGTLNISYSLIANSGGSGGTWQSTTGTDGGNNKDVDPQFVTPVDPTTAPTTAGDLRLLPASPAINMGNNTPIPVDAKDVDGDSDLTEPTPDLDGEDRILQSTVDMGAYEQLSCPSGSNLTLYVNAAAADGG
ncbi:MAG: choice-of-anchor Q domain-containing protein, partial [Thiothrix sp.]